MTSLFFLGNTILTICLYILILRLWMQRVRVNFYNPLTQIVIRITQPIIGPLRRLIPSIGPVDTATWILLYIVALIKIIFVLYYGMYLYYGTSGILFWDISYLFFAFVAIAHAIGHLIFWLLLFRAILSWVSRGQSVAEELLAQLTEPFIAPIRRILPPIGIIDISFMVVVFVLIFLNMFGNDLFGGLWVIL